MQHVVDPSFEEPASWTLGTDDTFLGAVIGTINPRTGLRALALTSRSVGPTSGFCEKQVGGLVPGNSYRIGLWWDAQGVSTQRNALVKMDGAVLGTIAGVTPGAGQYQRFLCPTVFVATAPTALLRIEQPAGNSSTAFTRYIDDVDVSDVEQGFSATPSSAMASSDPEAVSSSAVAQPLNPFGKPGYGA